MLVGECKFRLPRLILTHMRITTALLPTISSDSDRSDIVVVIDVLRATSVMAKALHAGASTLITCREIDQAQRMAQQGSPRPLLCGERGCKPIEGFDLGNSPSEYGEQVVGRTLILTTTNGTHAIESAAAATRMITASFLNFSAVVDQLGQRERVHLICAGTEGAVTAEDVLLAGAIVSACETRFEVTDWDDSSLLARQLWRSWFGERLPTTSQLSQSLRETRGGKNLLLVGFEADLDRCAAIDSAPVVPIRVSESPAAFALSSSL